MTTAGKIKTTRIVQNLSLDQAAARVRRDAHPNFVRAITTGQSAMSWWHAAELTERRRR